MSVRRGTQKRKTEYEEEVIRAHANEWIKIFIPLQMNFVKIPKMTDAEKCALDAYRGL